MRIDVVTIFPEYLEPLRLSLVGKAHDQGIVDIRVTDLRQYAQDRHRTVDDTPYGGGPGMVMQPTVWGDALDAVGASDPTRKPRLIIPTPSGLPFRQASAAALAIHPWMVIACGRYEGLDARIAEHYRTRSDWDGVDEFSVGDVVLAGGEAAALVMIEAIIRLIPGVLGNPTSVHDDSFSADTLEGPQFTRPQEWRGLEVPDVLLSGDHARISQWRRQQALQRTADIRPDLLAGGP
jgi:tRNA (guanine37-N1)-methyltransferase